MLSCKEVARLASDAMDRPLPLGRRMAIKLHIMMCGPCSRYVAQLKQLRRLINDYTEQAEQQPGQDLPPEARQRISQAIDEAMRHVDRP